MSSESPLPAVDQGRFLGALRAATGRDDLVFDEPPAFLAKGGEAVIDTFRLANAPPDFDKPLVLRRLIATKEPDQLRWEAAVHGALRAQAFPVPRVLYVEVDEAVIGHPFLVTELVTGEMLMGAAMNPAELSNNPARLPGLMWDALFRVPALLADTKLRLHALDPAVLRAKLTEVGFEPEDVSFSARLDALTKRLDAAEFAGLRQGAVWLRENLPSQDAEVICHGDLLFTNLFVEGGKVTGVFDWSNITLAESAYDVAATLSRLTSHIPNVPGVLKPVARALQWQLGRSYRRRYFKSMPLDRKRLGYYEAYWILTELSWSQADLTSGVRFDGSLEMRWLHPDTIAVGVRHFTEKTGVALKLRLPPDL